MSVIIKGYDKPRRCIECVGCFANMCLLKDHKKCPLDGTPEWCPMENIDENYICDVLCYYKEVTETEESLADVCEECKIANYCRLNMKESEV